MTIEKLNEYVNRFIFKQDYDFCYDKEYGYVYLQEELYCIKRNDTYTLVKARSPKLAIAKVKDNLTVIETNINAKGDNLTFIEKVGTLNIK